MPWEMNDREYSEVLARPAPERYAYLVAKLALCRKVYSLRNADGWVFVEDAGGREGVPVWPHPRFAAACATAGWSNCAVVMIPLYDWLNKWLPEMSRANRYVAAFMLPGDESWSVSVEPEAHREHLRRELEKR